jgi:hypothetical protein
LNTGAFRGTKNLFGFNDSVVQSAIGMGLPVFD